MGIVLFFTFIRERVIANLRFFRIMDIMAEFGAALCDGLLRDSAGRVSDDAPWKYIDFFHFQGENRKEFTCERPEEFRIPTQIGNRDGCQQLALSLWDRQLWQGRPRFC